MDGSERTFVLSMQRNPENDAKEFGDLFPAIYLSQGAWRGDVTSRVTVVVISDFTGAAIPADGMIGTPDVAYLASLDATNHQLWITMRPGWQVTHQISIE